MDTACIFKRIEKKYLLSQARYEALFQRIGSHLEPDEFGRSTARPGRIPPFFWS